MKTNIDDILLLPDEEKLVVAEKILESLSDEAPVPEWHRQILKERLEMYKDNLTEGNSWEHVKSYILNRK